MNFGCTDPLDIWIHLDSFEAELKYYFSKSAVHWMRVGTIECPCIGTELENFKEDWKQGEEEMAFKLGRKLGKLDAICANLKLKTQQSCPSENGALESGEVGEVDDDVEEAKTLTNGSPTPAADAPADLSRRSNNNNVIGKADLNSMDDEEMSDNEVLDFTMRPNHVSETNVNNDCDNRTMMEAGEDDMAEGGEVDDAEDECGMDSQYKVNCRDTSSIELKQMVNAMREKRKTKGPSVSTSRRKSRKSTIPRSITQVRDYYDQLDDKDELAEYEINNQNTNFPPDDCDEGEGEVERDVRDSGVDSLPQSRTHENRESPNYQNRQRQPVFQSRPSVISSLPSASAFAPLDLSVSKSKDDENSLQDDDSDYNDMDDSNHGQIDNDNEFIRSQRNLVIDEGKMSLPKQLPLLAAMSGGGFKPSSSDQVNHLKDFAESTMNELISMYGFGGLHHNDLAKHMPMKNFRHIPPHKLSPSPSQDRLSPGNQSVGGASLHNQPMSSGEEDYDRSTPIKGIYANYAGPGPTVPGKQLGKLILNHIV